jgi:NtrC-family two-component system sensor histidine kinase KinB
MVASVTVIFIITAVVSIIIGLFLYKLARLSIQAAAKEDGTRIKDRYSVSGSTEDLSLNHVIFEEMNKHIDAKHSQELASRLSSVVNNELKKKVEQTTQQLSSKYEKIIEGKAKEEEIAWQKYDKVFTEKKRTEAVIRSIAEGLVVVDADGKVIMMNPAAEKLLGVSKKDKIGKGVLDNLKEEHLVSVAHDTPDKEDREIELVSQQDETKKILRASSAVIENEYGQTVGMVSVLSDITKQKKLNEMKSNFVATVTHELRTPLVAIDKSISMILHGEAGQISETQQQFLSIAERNLKRLGILINDLLDLSKLEAGKMEIKKQSCLLDNVINEAIDGLNSWAKTKSITIERKIQEGLPSVDIDPSRIIQVLTNLLGNAIKFTPKEGSITVEAKCSNQKDKIEVSIQDTGVGIAKGDLPKIFDKFFQSGERVSTDISGTGIGLSVSKEIVQLHGGKIWAESERDAGAKFIFTLPVQ